MGRPHPTPARALRRAASRRPTPLRFRPRQLLRPRPFPRSLLLPSPSPYVEAAETRKKVPVWIVPVLVFLPFWAIFYVGYLENPPAAPEVSPTKGPRSTAASAPAAMVAVAVAAPDASSTAAKSCSPSPRSLPAPRTTASPATCTGSPTAPPVHRPRASSSTATRSPRWRPRPGSYGQMAGFGNLSPEQLVAVVYHVRHAFGADQITPEGDERELHVLDELYHLMEEEGVMTFEGATLPEIQGWVDAAASRSTRSTANSPRSNPLPHLPQNLEQPGQQGPVVSRPNRRTWDRGSLAHRFLARPPGPRRLLRRSRPPQALRRRPWSSRSHDAHGRRPDGRPVQAPRVGCGSRRPHRPGERGRSR